MKGGKISAREGGKSAGDTRLRRREGSMTDPGNSPVPTQGSLKTSGREYAKYLLLFQF